MISCTAPQQSTTWSASDDTTNWPIEGANPQRNRLVDLDIPPPLNQLLELPLIIADGQPTQVDTRHTSPVSVGYGLLAAESVQKLHVYDLTTGQQLWDFNLPGAFLSPTITEKYIFVRAESGSDGFLYALTTDKGGKLWQYQFPAVGSSRANMGGHVTSPLVVGDKVLAGASRTLRAFDIESGTEVWTFEMDDPIASSPSLSSSGTNSQIYVTDFQSIYALDVENGEQQWRFEHDELSLFFAPILMDDQVFITSGATAIALSQEDGTALWEQGFDETTVIPAAADTAHLYIKSANRLYALDRNDGAQVWSYSVLNFVSIPAVTQNQLYVVTRADGGSQLRAIDPADGSELWQVRNNRLSNAAPVIVGQRVFVRSVDGAVFAYQGTNAR